VKFRGTARCFGAASLLSVLLARPAWCNELAPLVSVYVAGSPEAISATQGAVQELCLRSSVAVTVRDAAGADEALLATSHEHGLAQAYVDLRPGTPPRVVIVDAETHQELARRVLPESSSLEMSIETVAHIVCSAVESSLATRVQRSSEPGQERRRRARGGSGIESQLTAFASGENFGAGFRGGVGGALALSAGRGPLRAGALLLVAGYPATQLNAADGVASFSSLGARLLPMLEWHASRTAVAFAAAGVGADRFGVVAQSAPPGAVAQTPPATIDSVASGMLGMRLQFSPRIGAQLALEADIDLSRHRYVIDSGQGRQVFFEPARVRPVGLLGLCVSFGGPAEEPDAAPIEPVQ